MWNQFVLIFQSHWGILLAALLFAAGRELSEHAKENEFDRWGPWWNTKQSWRNKTTWDDLLLNFLSNVFPTIFKKVWISRFIGKVLAAAFKTALVWTTDAEHFFQLISMLSVVFIAYSLGGVHAGIVVYSGNFLFGIAKNFTRLK